MVALAEGVSDTPSMKSISDIWPDFTPKRPDKTTVYDVKILFKPIEVSSDIYGELRYSNSESEKRDDVVRHLKEFSTPIASVALSDETQDEESSDDDSAPPRP